jgi:hypothetical protein
MKEVIISGWELLSDLSFSLWNLVSAATVWLGGLLYQLHVGAPRLEGLLIGVLLAWVLLRRHKHPLLRVVSSPLKLIVDILDLAWDQLVEINSDVWNTARSWASRVLSTCWKPFNLLYSWTKNVVVGGYNWVMNLLKSVKEKLSKKGE